MQVIYNQRAEFCRRNKQRSIVALLGESQEQLAAIDPVAEELEFSEVMLKALKITKGQLRSPLRVQMAELIFHGYSAKQISRSCGIPAATVHRFAYDLRRIFPDAYVAAGGDPWNLPAALGGRR